jgi:hypothetical protein
MNNLLLTCKYSHDSSAVIEFLPERWEPPLHRRFRDRGFLIDRVGDPDRRDRQARAERLVDRHPTTSPSSEEAEDRDGHSFRTEETIDRGLKLP